MKLKKNKSVKNKVIAFIPARGNSKRFPKKNIAKLFNKPLISYPIKEALKSNVFYDVVVSTDNDEIKKIAKKYGASITNRSKKNSSDTSHELESCREYFEILKKNNIELPNYFCVIYPTAVLLKAKDFKKTARLIQLNEKVEVVMGVSKYNYHPFKAMIYNNKGFLNPVYADVARKRSQTYREAYASNGTFYWHKTKCFLEKKYVGHYAKNIVGYLLENKVSMDIDYKEDLKNLKDYLKKNEI